jgi:hypothetical protein
MGTEPSFLTSTCCIGKDFSDENIEQIERIIERDCFQIKNEGDESGKTPRPVGVEKDYPECSCGEIECKRNP